MLDFYNTLELKPFLLLSYQVSLGTWSSLYDSRNLIQTFIHSTNIY